jgi:hypothetical protein
MSKTRAAAVVGVVGALMFLTAGTASASPPSPDPIWYSWFPTREMGDMFSQVVWILTGWMTGYGHF